MLCLASCIKKPTKLLFCPHNLPILTYHNLLNRIDNCSSILISTYFVWGSFLCEFMLFKVQTAKSSIVRNSVNSTVLIHAHKDVFWSDLVCWWFGESCSDFLERHIKIKSYQPFWCWYFLITHEFGQIFSSVALKVCCSLKSSGYQTEKIIFMA